MKLFTLAAMLVFAVGCDDTKSERTGSKEGASSGIPQAGVLVEALRDDVLPNYQLRSRRLSGPGLGYHYRFNSQSATVVITIGLFASGERAQQAAELSHELMPDKPESESGIGDQAWRWRSREGSAVRFRLEGGLVRVAGDMPYDKVRSMAEAVCQWLAAQQSVPPTEIHLAGLPERLSAGRAAEFRIADLPDGGPRPTIGAWVSRGRVTISQEGEGRLVAPSQPGLVRLRCFAIWDDNRISVADRTLQVRE